MLLDTGLSLSNASTFEFGLGIKQGTTPPSRQTIMDSNEPPYYSTYKWPLHTFLHTNFIMLKIMPIMLNYAVYANLCSRGAKIMLNLRNYANYALCSDSAITSMPESNAGIIGLAQSWEPNSLICAMCCRQSPLVCHSLCF